MSGSFDEHDRLDISDGRLIFCSGKKRSGKSIMALTLFRDYPWDKVVIDVAGDDGPTGPDVVELSGTVDMLPTKWPEGDRDGNKPMTVRYAPDTGSPTIRQDMDAVIGMAMSHGDCCVLVHEIGVVARDNQVQPNMTRLLNHNRHSRVSAIMCGPRPKRIDPLVLGQADVVYIFDTPVAADRTRIAESIGWGVRELSAEIQALGPHEYLRYDANESKPAPGEEDLRLTHWDPLPGDVVRQAMAYKTGQDPDPRNLRLAA